MRGLFKKGRNEGTQVTKEQVMEALSHVIEPELRRDLVSLNMVRDVVVDNGVVRFTVVLTTPACPLRSRIEQECREAVMAVPGVRQVEVNFTANVVRDTRVSNLNIRNIVAVASGKGGVGKSTVAVNLAIALAQEGAAVGLLDADIYGPNVPLMLGVNHLPPPEGGKVVPAEAYGVRVMSIGFLVAPDQPVIWRGPMLHTALRQFLGDVQWGELDYLIVDMPPGTGDVQLSLAQHTTLSGGVIVTTPQDVALADARKGLATFQKLNVPVLGIIENMSYFVAPDTGQRYAIFGSGGGRRYAQEIGVPFLGEVPIDPRIAEGGDTGTPIVIAAPESEAAQALRHIARQVAARLSVINVQREPEGLIGVGDIPVVQDR
ncbi:MAG: Mrp/NBP35 family ATP-binding protein [Ardenticatenia bacterium]|nr:Mrp/NBP35 family ATP-binding protein [Ardenticatenia bacterium]